MCYCGSCTVPRRSWRYHGGATAVMAVPRRSHCGVAQPAVLNMFKVSAVPPRRSAIMTVFRGATAITDGTTAESRRSWRCQCGLCRTSTAVAPRVRCGGGIMAFALKEPAKINYDINYLASLSLKFVV